MLSWCSFCQQFMGEIPPYEDLTVTHGLCPECNAKGDDALDDDLSHAVALRGLQDRLFTAGTDADREQAHGVIDQCLAMNMRPIDILVGLVTPILYRIGEAWANSIISVAEEHRFTLFCQEIIADITQKMNLPSDAEVAGMERPQILLINAPGNRHRLGIQILALWLLSHRARVEVVDRPVDVEDAVAMILVKRPRLLLVSLALAEQREGVVMIADRVRALPAMERPKIIAGGNAVKLGLVRSIPNCTFITDIKSLIPLAGNARTPGGSPMIGRSPRRQDGVVRG